MADLPIFAKYVLVVILSFLGIMLPYELLIRRFNPLRVLFGMRVKKKAKLETWTVQEWESQGAGGPPLGREGRVSASSKTEG